MVLNMYKSIILLLMANLTWVYANEQGSMMSEQEKSTLELLHSFVVYQKQFSGNIITVGGDPNGCQFSNIQDAIDSIPFSGTGEIHIATNKIYNENLVIDDINISLIGGYQDCTAAGSPFIQPSDNKVFINGGNSGSVIKVIGNFVDKTILLRNLRLIEGFGLAPNGEFTGGGILSYETSADILLNNVDVTSNDAQYGAGISIIGGVTNMLIQESLVNNNLAKYGAGIYCLGTGIDGSSIMMGDNSGVVANVANGIPVSDDSKFGRGGGVYVDSCPFTFYSGSEDGGLVGINSNIAFGNGGGLYAENTRIILTSETSCLNGICLGDSNNPVKISGNVAGFNNTIGSGGGIYAGDFGVSTTVTIDGSLIENNNAKLKGGGIMLDFAGLIVRHPRLQPCWDAARCNYFKGNFLHGVPNEESQGGAIFNFGNTSRITSSYFEENNATHGAAIAVAQLPPFSGNPGLYIGSSIFVHNGDETTESTFHTSGEADIQLIHVSIADNNFSDLTSNNSTFNTSSIVFNTERIPSLRVESSIIDNFGTPVLKHNMTDFNVEISCIIANETTSISSNNSLINAADNQPGGSYINQTIPGFVDRNNRDYHLASNSQAIDYCEVNSFQVPFIDVDKDIDSQDRGVDNPNIPNLSIDSFYDIGADEFIPLEEVIFENGFE